MITPEQHAEIRRLYFGEHWKVGTIAAALGLDLGSSRLSLVPSTRVTEESDVTFEDPRLAPHP